MEPVQFRSTNNKSSIVSLKEALLTGQAPDKGLYMPTSFPKFSQEELTSLKKMPYWEVAFTVINKFASTVISEERIRSICEEIYDFEVPLEHVKANLFVLRLDRGPTASFKDFAAKMMGKLIGFFAQEMEGNLTILTATSGDTGSAIANAFYGLSKIKIVVLFPIDEVSIRQRKQMTTLGKNVTTIAINGKFDDCQAIVKQAFSDPAVKSIRLSSANSINVGRLLPQICYYVYSFVQVSRNNDPIVFAVPSGNFGNLMGGLIAREMGVPISRFVVATNTNDEVPRFFDSGIYEKVSPSRVCLSNAMNVGHPSNLARLVDLYGGRMDETGKLLKPPDMGKIKRDLFAISIDDELTKKTIYEAYKTDKIILEPHGAVAWAGLKRLLETGEVGPTTPAISVSTAHPAKFPEQIKSILKIDPSPPPCLEGIEDRSESFLTMSSNYEEFREWLANR
ncbi:threonine synthase [bacterium]|nr:threonine synthase [bacterium]